MIFIVFKEDKVPNVFSAYYKALFVNFVPIVPKTDDKDTVLLNSHRFIEEACLEY
ncbi:hypothetical protein [Bacillus sp. SM2101]|uniref:hypothetical protein n=1 Tax=Bacillaceae TaxID=186817 RepID=UPI001BDDDDEC|nr:hypothetical protein [Bacillus sp. SM2101]